MKQVPLEIDDLMWRLAEEHNPVAQAEFEARHARYGPELARRIKMVAELRAAGKPVVHRPAFTPRPARASVPRGAMAATLGLAVLAVGALAYVVASGGEKVAMVKEPTPPPQIVVTPPTPPAPIIQKGSPPSPVPTPVKPQPEEEPKPAKTLDASKPVDLQIKDTALTAAIELVAKAGGLDVTVAPGFTDQQVTFDYGTLTPLDTLKTMGENYGFSVIEEDEGHYLVVPARAQSSDRRVGA